MMQRVFSLFVSALIVFLPCGAAQTSGEALIGNVYGARKSLVSALSHQYPDAQHAHAALSIASKTMDHSVTHLARVLFGFESPVPLQAKNALLRKHKKFLSTCGGAFGNLIHSVTNHITQNTPSQYSNGLHAECLYYTTNSLLAILLQESQLYTSTSNAQKMVGVQQLLLDNGAQTHVKEYDVFDDGHMVSKDMYFIGNALWTENIPLVSVLLKRDRSMINQPVVASVDVAQRPVRMTPLACALSILKYMPVDQCNAVGMAHMLLDHGASPVADPKVHVAAFFVDALKQNALARDTSEKTACTDRSVCLMKRFFTFSLTSDEIAIVDASIQSVLARSMVSNDSGWNDMAALVRNRTITRL